jgi:hypothetical protein
MRFVLKYYGEYVSEKESEHGGLVWTDDLAEAKIFELSYSNGEFRCNKTLPYGTSDYTMIPVGLLEL